MNTGSSQGKQKTFQRSPSGVYVVWYPDSGTHSKVGMPLNRMMEVQRWHDQPTAIKLAWVMSYERAYELSGYVY